jgi:hypothetical protein
MLFEKFHTAAMSFQYPKKAACFSKIYYHTSLQDVMVLVPLPLHNCVYQPCCYYQLFKTLSRHTNKTHTNVVTSQANFLSLRMESRLKM